MTFRQFLWRSIPWNPVLFVCSFIQLQIFLIWFPDWYMMGWMTVMLWITVLTLVAIASVLDVRDKTRLATGDIIEWFIKNGYILALVPTNNNFEIYYSKWKKLRKKLRAEGHDILYEANSPRVVVFKNKKAATLFRLQNTDFEPVNIHIQKWNRARPFVPDDRRTGHCSPDLL